MGKLSWIIQGAQSNPKGPCTKKAAGSESEGSEGARLLALNKEEGVKSQEMQAACRRWKGKEVRSLLDSPEVTQPY